MQIEFGAMTEKGREKIIQSGAFLARRLFYSRQGADAPRVGGKVPEIRTSPLPSALGHQSHLSPNPPQWQRRVNERASISSGFRSFVATAEHTGSPELGHRKRRT